VTVQFTRNGDVEIAYETFGSAPGRPLLLIHGADAGRSAAHIVGVSLGGMIGQVMAARHQDRVLSLTSMCSAPDASLRRTRISVMLRYFALTWRQPSGPEAAGERLVKLLRLVGSTGHPQDEDWLRRIGREGHAASHRRRRRPAPGRRGSCVR
jgi:pimeloyl-ACP methyl ester carboxylesterase